MLSVCYENLYLIFRIKDICFDADAMIESICFDHLLFEDKYTPRCL